MPGPTEPTAGPAQPGDESDNRLRRRSRQRLVTIALFVVVSAISVLPGALGDKRVSVFDETTHADWVSALRDGRIVERGDTLDPDVLVEWSCRGWALPSTLPPCDGPASEASAYPAMGLNYNHFHPPLYYVVTAAGSAIVAVVAPEADVVTSSRVVGVVWATAAMLAVYAVARELGARVSVARTTALLVVAFPLLTHLFSIVNNDAAVVAVGGLVTWVGLRIVRTGVPWWLAVGAGAVAGLTKVVVLPVVLAAAVFVAVVAIWWRPVGERRRLLGSMLLLVVAFAAVSTLWLGVQSLRASDITYVDPTPGDVVGSGVPMALIGVAFDTFPPTSGPRSPVSASTEVVQAAELWRGLAKVVVASVPLALIAAGAAPAAALRRRRSDPASPDPAGPSAHLWLGVPLGVSVAVALVVGAVALNTQHWLAKGSALSSLHSRYGIALVAALLGGLAMLVDDHRVGRIALWLFTIAGLASSVALNV